MYRFVKAVREAKVGTASGVKLYVLGDIVNNDDSFKVSSLDAMLRQASDSPLSRDKNSKFSGTCITDVTVM
jgi:hypothetical protein